METLTEGCSNAWNELWQKPQYLLYGKSFQMNAVGHRVMPMVFLRVIDAVEAAVRRRIRASSKPMLYDLRGGPWDSACVKTQIPYIAANVERMAWARISESLFVHRIAIVEPLKTTVKRSA